MYARLGPVKKTDPFKRTFTLDGIKPLNFELIMAPLLDLSRFALHLVHDFRAIGSVLFQTSLHLRNVRHTLACISVSISSTYLSYCPKYGRLR